MTHFNQAELKPASWRNQCRICNKANWCSIATDGSIVICMRVADGAIQGTRNNGFLHVLKPLERAFTPRPLASLPKEEKPYHAPAGRRHAVYTALLDALTLDERHANNLLARGLSDSEAARNLHSSLPNSMRAAELCAALFARFDLEGVPGFFRGARGRWTLASKGTGFLIPVRDAQGRIQACQIRFDAGAPRYRWLSSKGRNGGASSGTPVHVARPWRVASTGEALLTEGALKADLIAEQLDCCVVAVAGVANFREEFGTWLRAELPALRTVLLALDADWHTKPEVERAMLRLLTSVERAGLSGGLFDWSEAKGLDDLLCQEVSQ